MYQKMIDDFYNNLNKMNISNADGLTIQVPQETPDGIMNVFKEIVRAEHPKLVYIHIARKPEPKELHTIIVKLKIQPMEPPRETDALFESVEHFLQTVHMVASDYDVLKLGRNCGVMTNEIEESK